MKLTCLEICAGAGGQALGLEMAGFDHAALVEIDERCCATLKLNRPGWNVLHGDVRSFDGTPFRGIDLFAGGVPCPPFSVAGKQLGSADERDLFPSAIRLVQEIQPKAVLLENVRGLLDPRFEEYRSKIVDSLYGMGYATGWRLLNACDFGVPQLRPRVLLVAIKRGLADGFVWPARSGVPAPTVGSVLHDLIAASGWLEANDWRLHANDVAPTVVGGSSKHGGPDLGPTRAKKAWASMGVDGHGIADEPPSAEFSGRPRLTLRMVARLQGFPDSWKFSGGKTAAYRQVGNAFPPPVARAVATQVAECLNGRKPRPLRPCLAFSKQEQLFSHVS
jgi:DNA (cytosine-5)-methyltransferase 1